MRKRLRCMRNKPVQEFSLSPAFRLNDRREAAFCWDCAVDPRSGSPHQYFRLERQPNRSTKRITLLKDTADAGTRLVLSTRFRRTQSASNYARACDECAHRLLLVVLLVFKFHEKLPASRLADAARASHGSAQETKDLMRKSEHMGFYLAFLDAWIGTPPMRQRIRGTCSPPINRSLAYIP